MAESFHRMCNPRVLDGMNPQMPALPCPLQLPSASRGLVPAELSLPPADARSAARGSPGTCADAGSPAAADARRILGHLRLPSLIGLNARLADIRLAPGPVSPQRKRTAAADSQAAVRAAILAPVPTLVFGGGVGSPSVHREGRSMGCSAGRRCTGRAVECASDSRESCASGPLRGLPAMPRTPSLATVASRPVPVLSGCCSACAAVGARVVRCSRETCADAVCPASASVLRITRGGCQLGHRALHVSSAAGVCCQLALAGHGGCCCPLPLNTASGTRLYGQHGSCVRPQGLPLGCYRDHSPLP